MTLDEKVTALLANPDADPRVLIGCLKAIEEKVDHYSVLQKPLKKAGDQLREALLALLNSKGIRTLKFDDIGAVTRAELKTFKLEDRPAFWQWLETQRATLPDPTEVYSFFGATLAKEMLTSTLTDTGQLPAGVTTNTIQTLRFTPTKEST